MRRDVCVYDNGGRTVDRYAVLIARTVGGRRVLDVYGMSEDPQSPQGFNQFSHTAANKFRDFKFLGKRVKAQNLPKPVISAIESRV